MTNVRRLIEEEPASFRAALIRAAQREAPAPSVRRASAAALGIVSLGTVGTVSSTASAAGATSGIVSLGTVGATASAVGATSGMAKLALIAGAKGLVAGFLVFGTIAVTPRLINRVSERPPASVDVRTASSAISSSASAHVSEPALIASSTPDLTTTPVPVPASPATSTVSSWRGKPRPVAPAARDARLAEEIRVLERIQQALARGDLELTLSELAAYERQFPRGTLSPEAAVLRIEALVARGELEAARAHARELLAKSPNAPAAQRIRRLTALDTDPAEK